MFPLPLVQSTDIPAHWPAPRPPHRLLVISGGQTGVDRAALDAALALDMPVAGWCPRGRLAEDGAVPGRYALTETDSSGYTQRTGQNVRDACATLILTRGALGGGTRRTALCARRMGRPLFVARLGQTGPAAVLRWIRLAGVLRLNVAGSRESLQPGIYAQARRFLEGVFALLDT
ncbi:putative molybdenum carrier protein [Fundidesulfovibrio butyratiphilus]